MTRVNKVAVSPASVCAKDKKLILNGPSFEQDIPVNHTLRRPLSHDHHNGGTIQCKRPAQFGES
jgi:hypothetical protein